MNPYRHLTIIGLIVVAAMVYIGEQTERASYAEGYGTVPAVVVGAFRGLTSGRVSLANVGEIARLVTSIFLHGSPEHLIYNMVFLWTFGYLVAEYLGQWWALAIFLICGVCGNLAQTALKPESMVPIVGASGAISGLAGVYLGLALRWQLAWSSVWPLAYPVPPLQLAAFAVIGFAGDIFFLANRAQGIAYGAHVGGFLTGLAIATILTTIYPSEAAYERAGRKH